MTEGRQPLTRASFSSEYFEERRRTELWSALMRPVAAVVPADVRPMHASLVAYDIGQMIITRTAVSASRYTRNPARPEHARLNSYVLLQMMLKGSASGVPGKVRTGVAQHDIYLLDMGKAADISVGASAHITLLMPRDALDEPGVTTHGRVLRKGQLPNRMISRHLMQLSDALPRLDTEQAEVAAELTREVLRASLAPSLVDEGAGVSSVALQARILSYVDNHLDDVELGAVALQERFHLSRSHLYRIFSHYGGIERYLLERRLDAATRELLAHPDRPISDIVYRHGFSSERQFQRGFRSRFGMPSSALRRARA